MLLTVSIIASRILMSAILLESPVYAVRMKRSVIPTVNVSETAKPGTVVVNTTEYGTCILNSSDPNEAVKYFRFDKDALVLNSTVDLEFMEKPYNNILVTLTCNNTPRNLTVDIIPENEFSPQFNGAPFIVPVLESTKKGEPVFDLSQHVYDTDKVQYGDVVKFSLHGYLIPDLDGREHFSINSTSGELTTLTDFDFESLTFKYFILNASITGLLTAALLPCGTKNRRQIKEAIVIRQYTSAYTVSTIYRPWFTTGNHADDGGRVSGPGIINCTIMDEDDMPPEFSAGHYHSNIDIHFQGMLDHVVPTAISASDGDQGINAIVSYSIVTDSMEEIVSNIRIDNTTGTLYILEPFVNVTNITDLDPYIVTMTIVATEDTPNTYTDNATMTLFVYRELPTPPTTLTSTQAGTHNATAVTEPVTDDNAESTLLLKILIPCCVFVGLIIIIIVVLLVRKQRETKEKKTYSVRGSERELKMNGAKDIGVDTLSSTMINAYDLLGAYAHIDLGARNADDSESARDASGSSGESAHDPESNEGDYQNADDTDVRHEGDGPRVLNTKAAGLYTSVEKRKPRKRKNTVNEYQNEDIEEVMENDVNNVDNVDES